MDKGLSSNLVNYYLSYTKQGCKNLNLNGDHKTN